MPSYAFVFRMKFICIKTKVYISEMSKNLKKIKLKTGIFTFKMF